MKGAGWHPRHHRSVAPARPAGGWTLASRIRGGGSTPAPSVRADMVHARSNVRRCGSSGGDDQPSGRCRLRRMLSARARPATGKSAPRNANRFPSANVHMVPRPETFTPDLPLRLLVGQSGRGIGLGLGTGLGNEAQQQPYQDELPDRADRPLRIVSGAMKASGNASCADCRTDSARSRATKGPIRTR